jgi:tetratricopeptide (TPR) repeat protein
MLYSSNCPNWFKKLQTGTMSKVEKLLADLHSQIPERRQSATMKLWNYWYFEAGELGELEIQKGVDLMDQKNPKQAQFHFESIIKKYPDFAEAHNKLATVLFLMEDYEGAVKECEVTLRMNPNHFGAWHGKGLCLYKLASYSEAIESFKSALKIQPYADINRVYIATCMGNLN